MDYLEKITLREYFSEDEAYRFIYAIEQDKLSSEVIAGILIGIQLRGVQLEELKGFQRALLELSIAPELERRNTIDLCGTGGDGKDTFNISTTSSFILSAMGKRVIKHGNYGVSSSCGSSNVLEALGVQLTNDVDKLNKSLDEKNICFLHAPLFHPTIKKVASIRKNLGVRTVFNSIGPLVNPTQPEYQLTGTYSLELAKTYQHILKNQREDYKVVHGMDGFDEITLTNDTRILGKYTDNILNAQSFNVASCSNKELKSGASIQDSANIVRSILKGKGTTAQNTVIAANVASALQLFEPAKPIKDLFERSFEFIKGGSAIKQLTTD